MELLISCENALRLTEERRCLAPSLSLWLQFLMIIVFNRVTAAGLHLSHLTTLWLQGRCPKSSHNLSCAGVQGGHTFSTFVLENKSKRYGAKMTFCWECSYCTLQQTESWPLKEDGKALSGISQWTLSWIQSLLQCFLAYSTLIKGQFWNKLGQRQKKKKLFMLV